MEEVKQPWSLRSWKEGFLDSRNGESAEGLVARKWYNKRDLALLKAVLSNLSLENQCVTIVTSKGKGYYSQAKGLAFGCNDNYNI